MERQKYPDLHEYPGGPPKRPYDVTAHTLPLLFGVEVAAVMGPEPAGSKTLVAAVADPVFTNPLSGTTGRRVAVFRPSTNTFYLWNSTSISGAAPDLNITLGADGDLPLVGDWDGL